MYVIVIFVLKTFWLWNWDNFLILIKTNNIKYLRKFYYIFCFTLSLFLMLKVFHKFSIFLSKIFLLLFFSHKKCLRQIRILFSKLFFFSRRKRCHIISQFHLLLHIILVILFLFCLLKLWIRKIKISSMLLIIIFNHFLN